MVYSEITTFPKWTELTVRTICCNERNGFPRPDNSRIFRNRFLCVQIAFPNPFHLPCCCLKLNPDEFLDRDLTANPNPKPSGLAKGRTAGYAKSYKEDVFQDSEHTQDFFTQKKVSAVQV